MAKNLLRMQMYDLLYKPGGLYQRNDRDSVSSKGAWVKDNAFIVQEIQTDCKHFFRVHRLYFHFFTDLTT